MKRYLLLIIILLAPNLPAEDKKEAMPIKISGEFDLRGVWRQESIDEMVMGLNSGIVALNSGNATFGYTKLRLDIEAKPIDNMTLFLQLESRVIDGDRDSDGKISAGDLIKFPSFDQIRHPLRQAYFKLSDFPIKDIYFKVGQQNLDYSLRPKQESFAFNLAESESPFARLNAAATAARNSVERDLLRPAGVKVRLGKDFWALDGFAFTYSEGIGKGQESVYGIFAEVLPTPKLSIMSILTKISSSRIAGDNLWLGGFGVDYNLNEWLELFGEIYFNFGRLAGGIRKSGAFGLNMGSHIQLDEKFWMEGAFSYLSGDKRPTDSKDSSFQSYENINTFAIIEDKELGMDIDTNYRAFKFAAGAGPFKVFGDKNLLLRADLGFFSFNQPLFSPAGVKFLTSNNKDLGAEFDLGATFEYNDNLSFFAKGAFLFSSDALDAITAETSTGLFYIGANIKF